MFNAWKLFYFLLSNGGEIGAQIDALIAFAKSLQEKFKGEGDGASVMSVDDTFDSDEAIEALANEHPSVAAACCSMDTDGAEATAQARPRGALRDLFKAIADDPQKYIDLFLLFKNLFAGGLATTQAEPESA